MTVYAIIIRIRDKEVPLGSTTDVNNAKFITGMLDQLREVGLLKVDEVICKVL